MVSRQNIIQASKDPLKSVNFPSSAQIRRGKVRDIYKIKDKHILITTDRISAFDRVLGFIPYKGQVLNQLSEFWFAKCKKIVPNHFLKVIHANVMVVLQAKPLPVEMVVRGYITGVTSTSLWQNYARGKRVIYGQKFPDGLKKNQKLKQAVITPTTKAEKGQHDKQLSEKEILAKKLVERRVWQKMKKVSLELFKSGTKVCAKQGIILVDTKYEFGLINNKLVLIDEIHTPDSSRFWKKKSYYARFKKGLEPENFDKEFFRKWYVARGYRGDGQPPKMDKELMVRTSQRYVSIYELITTKKFIPQKYPLEKSIKKVIGNYLKKVN